MQTIQYKKKTIKKWVDDLRYISSKKTYKWPKRIWKHAQNHELLETYKSKLQWAITSHWSEWMSSKSLQIINAGESVDKRNPLGGNVNWYSHYGEQYGSSLKNYKRIPFLSIYPKKTIIQKDTHTPMPIAALFTIVNASKRTKCPSTDEWLKM